MANVCVIDWDLQVQFIIGEISRLPDWPFLIIYIPKLEKGVFETHHKFRSLIRILTHACHFWSRYHCQLPRSNSWGNLCSISPLLFLRSLILWLIYTYLSIFHDDNIFEVKHRLSDTPQPFYRRPHLIFLCKQCIFSDRVIHLHHIWFPPDIRNIVGTSS